MMFDNLDKETSLATAWDDKGNLVVAYNKIQITLGEKQIELEDGNIAVISNVPLPGQIDLCILKRSLHHDLGFKEGDMTLRARDFLFDADVNMTLTVRNLGDFAEENVTVSFFVSDPDRGMQLIERQVIPGWFDANSTVTLKSHYSINTNKQLNFTAIVDCDYRINEFDETNNTIGIVPGGTDLEPFLKSSAVRYDGSATVQFDVGNLSPPESEFCELTVYRPDVNGILVATKSIPPILPGSKMTLNVEIPAGSVLDKNTSFEVVVDQAQQITDVDRSNNSRKIILSWIPTPTPIPTSTSTSTSTFTETPSPTVTPEGTLTPTPTETPIYIDTPTPTQTCITPCPTSTPYQVYFARGLNLAQAAPGTEFYLNDNRFTQRLNYLQGSPYSNHFISPATVKAISTSDHNLVYAQLSNHSPSYLDFTTYALYEDQSSLDIIQVTRNFDSNSSISLNIQFIHLDSELGSLKISDISDENVPVVLCNGLSYQSISASLDLNTVISTLRVETQGAPYFSKDFDLPPFAESAKLDIYIISENAEPFLVLHAFDGTIQRADFYKTPTPTPTATATATPMFSLYPTSTASPTESPTPSKPFILAAGWDNTSITERAGGNLTLHAVAMNSQSTDISHILMTSFYGIATDILLPEIDAWNGYYSIKSENLVFSTKFIL